MAAISYVLCARDVDGLPLVHLKPSWVFLQALGTAVPIEPVPVFKEVAYGQYQFSYDPNTSGDASGQVDLGESVHKEARYVDIVCYRTVAKVSAPIDPSSSKGSTHDGDSVASVSTKARMTAFTKDVSAVP